MYINKMNFMNITENRKKTWKILREIIFWILLIFLVMQIILTFMVNLTPKFLMKINPIQILEVTSDSMYPKFHTGDGLLIDRTAFDKLQKGDMVTFFADGNLVTHEIVEIGDDGTITTEGIANGIPDNPITKNEYVGKVRLIVPGFSKFLSMTYGPGRKALWIILVIVVCFGNEIFSVIYDWIGERGKKREKK